MVKKTKMKTNEMRELIRIKNNLLQQQTRRIELLEEKMSELRKRYFQLKYVGRIQNVKLAV